MYLGGDIQYLQCGMNRTIESMWNESSHRLTFPDGQSFALAVPLSSETELRLGSPTQQRDRASPWQSHSAVRQSSASAVPLSSETELRLGSPTQQRDRASPMAVPEGF
jgi:hypothetical protein